ncbi:hypothetical protein CERSUDRAFT_69926 [Gelatoporia subvermispora B]|uniref:Uncharacterized protein n=1 Tax=Ceriporiopsis subvermispora (strain B) TaxID=914234 RepID=M2QW73_CERS8|nr:hypothetical protein CERSUDRAFT_69926 [Gelatoporia subvermispora B]
MKGLAHQETVTITVRSTGDSCASGAVSIVPASVCNQVGRFIAEEEPDPLVSDLSGELTFLNQTNVKSWGTTALHWYNSGAFAIDVLHGMVRWDVAQSLERLRQIVPVFCETVRRAEMATVTLRPMVPESNLGGAPPSVRESGFRRITSPEAEGLKSLRSCLNGLKRGWDDVAADLLAKCERDAGDSVNLTCYFMQDRPSKATVSRKHWQSQTHWT